MYSLSETVVASIRLSDQVALLTLLLSLFSCLSDDGPFSSSVASACVILVTVCLSIAFLILCSDGQLLRLTLMLRTEAFCRRLEVHPQCDRLFSGRNYCFADPEDADRNNID